MKVCSGTAKGITLKCPPGMNVRPTSARARQAIFSALSGRLRDSTVLDLFAGTGAMGIEALSRGAARAFFVELSPRCARTIRENLQHAGLSQNATVIKGDALRITRRLGRQNRKFDVVIADPPYDWKKSGESGQSLAEKTLKVVAESDILRANSVVILEHSESGVGFETGDKLRLLSEKKHGDTTVSIFCPTSGLQKNLCAQVGPLEEE